METFAPGQVQRLAEIFNSLTIDDPAIGRDRRSSFHLLFVKAGIKRAQDDPRSRAFLVELRAASPGFGYFISADPPIYHLRELCYALSIVESEAQHRNEIEVFSEVHSQIYLEASSVARRLRDGDTDALEVAFATNLLHSCMNEDIRRRAMQELVPVLLAVFPTPTSRLAKLAFAEAEALTGRSIKEFATPGNYVREMQRLAG